MRRIYKGYPGGDILYYHGGNALYEAFGNAGSPVATVRGNRVFYVRGADSGEMPAGTFESTSGGFEVYAGYGQNIAMMGFIHGNLLMDLPGGQVIMSADSDNVAGLAMACVLRFGDDSLRTNVDVRNPDIRRNGVYAEFDNFESNAPYSMRGGDYMRLSRANAGFGDEESFCGGESGSCGGEGDSCGGESDSCGEEGDFCGGDEIGEDGLTSMSCPGGEGSGNGGGSICAPKLIERANYTPWQRRLRLFKMLAIDAAAVAGVLLGIMLIHSFTADAVLTAVLTIFIFLPVYFGSVGIKCLMNTLDAWLDTETYERDVEDLEQARDAFPEEFRRNARMITDAKKLRS